jgi:presenilin-like A22 family membrane protease
MEGRRLDPPGTTPWDRWQGARIGGFVGAVVGGISILFMSERPFWPVLALAAVGAVAGFVIEARKSR